MDFNMRVIIKGVIDYTRDHPEMSREQILGVFTATLDALEQLPDAELDVLAGRDPQPRWRRWISVWR